jgi:hypothetical protein
MMSGIARFFLTHVEIIGNGHPLSPRGRTRNREGAQDVKSWARTTNKLQVASGRLSRSDLHRGFLRGYVN